MAQKGKIILGISSNIIFLGIVSFFTDISTEMVVAILPTFLVLNLGATPEIVGLIEGAAESLTSFIRLISGRLSDVTGKRKSLTAAGYSLSNAVKPLMGLVASWPQVMALRMGDRVGKGLRTPPRDAIIADSSEEQHMGKSFGLHRTLDQLGAIVGPILAFLLLVPLGYNGIFILTIIPGTLAVLVLLLFVREPPKRAQGNNVTLHNAREVMNRKFLFYIGSATLYAVSSISYAFILLRAIEIGIPQEYSPLVYAAIQISHVASSLPAGEISDRFGRVKAVQLGYASLVLAFITIATTSDPQLMMLGVVLFGINQGIVETSQRAIIPSLVPQDLKGTAYGVYNTAVGAVTFPTNLIAGFIFMTYGSASAFIYGAAFGIFASVMMAVTGKVSKQGQ
uniref:MFS transporter n=1 Tax=Candidatus Methanomethylicus mesodigestus TaxID=1867258 RepID=A0A7C3ES81_9CREN